MDGFRPQSFSDTTKSPTITNQSRTPSSTVFAPSPSSVLHFNPNRALQNPIRPFSHHTNFHPSIAPTATPTSILGVSSSRLPLPVTFSHSSCHFFPSSSKGLLKEEHSCSSVSFSSSSASSDSDYDSAPLKSSATLQRRSAENDSPMATQRYGPTEVAMGNDEALQFKQCHQPTTEETMTKTEDESRKRIRRERNKQAAARCRQRRVDLTNHLMAETETLDMVRADLQREVENLVHQKNQLEFILQAHTTHCRMIPPSSSPPGSIPQFVKLESSDTNFLQPPSASCQVSASTISAQLPPHCQLRQAGTSILNSSNQMAPKGSAKQVTSTTSANHMPFITSANLMASTSLSEASCRNTMSPMSGVTATLPTTSDAELLVSPMTLDALNSFDFDTLLDAHIGPTRVIGVPSSSSTNVNHSYSDEISPTLLNL